MNRVTCYSEAKMNQVTRYSEAISVPSYLLLGSQDESSYSLLESHSVPSYSWLRSKRWPSYSLLRRHSVPSYSLLGSKYQDVSSASTECFYSLLESKHQVVVKLESHAECFYRVLLPSAFTHYSEVKPCRVTRYSETIVCRVVLPSGYTEWFYRVVTELF